MSNLTTVQEIYQAFGRGDIPAILDRLREDVSWERWPTGHSAQAAGVPYLAEATGREGVAGFFGSLEALEFNRFEPVAFLEGGNDVLARISVDITVRASGHRIQDDELHYWTFDDDGQVAEFRHYVDTGKHLEAWSAAQPG